MYTFTHTYTHTHQGKKGNLILPLWFDSSNCSNDSSVVLWVLWMSPEPVISPLGTRGWERMLLQPTKWPLNHRLWSHSELWKSVHLLLDVSAACLCVDDVLCCQCTTLSVRLCERVDVVWIKIVWTHGCIVELHIVSVEIVRQRITTEVQIVCIQILWMWIKRSLCCLSVFSNGRGHDSKHDEPASLYCMKYSVYTCCIIWFQIGQWMCDEIHNVYNLNVAN